MKNQKIQNKENANKVEMVLPIKQNTNGMNQQYNVCQMLGGYKELAIEILYKDDDGLNGLKITYDFSNYGKVRRALGALYELGLVGEVEEEEV